MIGVVVYHSQNPAKPAEEYIAFITREGTDKKTGEKFTERLPVLFSGTTAEIAEMKARKFWTEERTKEMAKRDRVNNARKAKASPK